MGMSPNDLEMHAVVERDDALLRVLLLAIGLSLTLSSLHHCSINHDRCGELNDDWLMTTHARRSMANRGAL
jgi:hypothetical protein